MTEQQIEAIEIEDVETEETEVLVEDVVEELTETEFGSDEEITAYRIHKIVNGVFKVVGFEKKVPPQMIYNYSKNGLINGTKDMKQKYNKSDVKKWVLKYVTKQINK